MSKPVFQDLFKFTGRRNRQSYLLVSLAQFASLFLIAFISVAGIALVDSDVDFLGWILLLASFGLTGAVIVSSWAVGSQRIRDFDQSGVWILVTVLPYIGWIFAVALWFIPSTTGANKYGPSCIE